MNRLFAALGAVAVVGGVALGVAGTANAATPVLSASQVDCNNAAAATATAQMNYNNALNVAVARAKELGFTPDQITQAENLLAQGINQNTQAQLMMIYSEHANALNLVTDLPKIKAVVDTRLAFDAAQAAQNIACAGFMPMVTPTPMTTPPAATPAMPTPTLTTPMTTPAPMVMPKGAAGTGDGTTLNPGHHF